MSGEHVNSSPYEPDIKPATGTKAGDKPKAGSAVVPGMPPKKKAAKKKSR